MGGEALISGVAESFDVDGYLATIAAAKVIKRSDSRGFFLDIAKKLRLNTLSRLSERILVLPDGDPDEVREIVDGQFGVDADIGAPADLEADQISGSDYGYAVSINPAFSYDPYYLLTRLSTFKYANVEFVTQHARFADGQEIDGESEKIVQIATDRNLTMVPTNNKEGLHFISGKGAILRGQGFATSKYGVDFATFLRRTGEERAAAARLTVIVPVFNNGEYLLAKCLPSLLRNRMWHEMEILLVDDGSTDSATIGVVKLLETAFPNVRTFFFKDGGSGSASRPRNKGVKMATTEWITYLDPDNEISPGGYDALFEVLAEALAKGLHPNFVSGFQVKLGKEKKLTGAHTKARMKHVADAKSSYFLKGKFPVVSTQCALLSRRMLIENDITFVEGAAGQDTLYGWQVLALATDPIFTADSHLLYYSERIGSITNEINIKYFRRCLVREKRQVEILEHLGLLQAYKKHHYDRFMYNWYIPKLNQLPVEDRGTVKAIVNEIAAVYSQTPPRTEK